jgi:hypothetical protein
MFALLTWQSTLSYFRLPHIVVVGALARRSDSQKLTVLEEEFSYQAGNSSDRPANSRGGRCSRAWEHSAVALRAICVSSDHEAMLPFTFKTIGQKTVWSRAS